jgi:cytochrome c oxidase cbb3-type subunit IV
MMDINELRSAVTVIGLLLFLALVVSVYRSARRQAFDAAAQIPFAGEAEHGPSAGPLPSRPAPTRGAADVVIGHGGSNE